MLKNNYIELVNKEIDGTITADEKTELKQLLITNFEFRKYYYELSETVEMLNKTSKIPLTPSPNLKKNIFNNIDQTMYATVQSKKSKTNFLRKFRYKLKPEFAITFAFGLITGLFLFLIIFHYFEFPSGNKLNYLGTMGLVNNKYSKIISTTPLLIPEEIEGSITLTKLNNNYWVEVKTNSINSFTFKFLFDQSYLRFDNITPLNTNTIELKKGKNFIQIAGNLSLHYYLFFNKINNENTNIICKVISSRDTVLSKVLAIKL